MGSDRAPIISDQRILPCLTAGRYKIFSGIPAYRQAGLTNSKNFVCLRDYDSTFQFISLDKRMDSR
jgi:hypothetical protein